MRDRSRDRSDAGLGAMRFEDTVESVHKRENRLYTLLQGEPSTLENIELIRAYKFAQRFISRLIDARKDAEDPKVPFGVIALGQVREGNFPEERAKAIERYNEQIAYLFSRLGLFGKEIDARHKDGKIKDEEVPPTMEDSGL
jgi:hypothetical protein